MDERWEVSACDIYGPEYFGKAINSNQAKRIAKRHNADCDAYEARIAELEADNTTLEYSLADYGDTPEEKTSLRQQVNWLEAELARVKAESLRVVEVGISDHGLLHDWYMTPTGLGYPGKDRKQNNCIESAEGYYRLDECKPVRLERWEAEA